MSNSTTVKRIVGTSAAVAVSAGVGLAVGATPANAATVWDRVAACESSGNWSINTGNGFYGGLQFSLSTWRGYGGSGMPQNASKAEQIRIAKKVLKSQGPGAWPVCSVRAGLTRANGAAAGGGSSDSSYSAHKKTKKAKHSSGKTSSKDSSSKARRGSKSITVRSGDTLAKIAHRYHVKGGWKAVYKLNPQLKNPNRIFVGQHIYV
ncbi:LysM repeat protein [Friedmanniella endophytica]|uniref:LysM repeat protein n=1 Tax=Microlunatus kandeliicorticis TaxID=1759536 RepID=A0A7W3P5K2_9ACTN|nr:transglycosylase family protein [Microlunatus kandeliicorticis]MBA8794023.1 LysM repeat protein [Microlunatus kandeliicorticis]